MRNCFLASLRLWKYTLCGKSGAVCWFCDPLWISNPKWDSTMVRFIITSGISRWIKVGIYTYKSIPDLIYMDYHGVIIIFHHTRDNQHIFWYMCFTNFRSTGSSIPLIILSYFLVHTYKGRYIPFSNKYGPCISI